MIKNEIKSKRGRPEGHYTLLPLAEVEQALPRWADKRIEEARHQERGTTPNISADMIDALDGDPRRAAVEIAGLLPAPSDQTRTSAWLARKNLGELARALKDVRHVPIPLDCADPRAALFAAENDPNEGRSVIDIKREYGVSRGGVPTLVQRAGMQGEAQTVDCLIASMATFEQDVYQARKEHRGYPRALVEVKPSGVEVEHYYDPKDPDANRTVIAAAQQAGSAIKVRLQTANKYRPVEGQQPVMEPKVTQLRSLGFHEPSDIRPHYGPDYNPSVVRHWLKTHLRRLKWHELGAARFVNPETGEVFDLGEKDLADFAESLGATVTRVAS